MLDWKRRVDLGSCSIIFLPMLNALLSYEASERYERPTGPRPAAESTIVPPRVLSRPLPVEHLPASKDPYIIN